MVQFEFWLLWILKTFGFSWSIYIFRYPLSCNGKVTIITAEKGVCFLKNIEINIYLYLQGGGFNSSLGSESVKNCNSP